MNEYLKFYEKYKISPIVQNIENFTEHIKKRTNLYRQLSILPVTGEGRDILVIGPGGGYNVLSTNTYNPKTYTLVEPNTTGYNELKENFSSFMKKKNIFIYNDTLEIFKFAIKYDVIICERLIPGLNSKEHFIEKNRDSNKISKMRYFKSAFDRSQLYVSFVKAFIR